MNIKHGFEKIASLTLKHLFYAVSFLVFSLALVNPSWSEDKLVNTSVVLTGITGPAVSGNIIIVDQDNQAQSLRYYDISSEKLIDISGAALAFDTGVEVSEDAIYFITFEEDIQQDLNNNGNLENYIVRYYDLKKGEIVSTGVEANYSTQLSLSGNILAFATFETCVNQDLNGDGSIDEDDLVVRYLDKTSGKVFNTRGIISDGASPRVSGNIIAFPTDEAEYGDDLNGDGKKNDTVLRYYNIAGEELVNTGAEMAGDEFALFDNKIAFRSGEFSIGADGLDLNGDNDKVDIIVRYFDLLSGSIVNTGADIAAGMSMSKDIIVFMTNESQVKSDLNADGDTRDLILRYYDFSSGKIVNTAAEIFMSDFSDKPSVSGKRIAFITKEILIGKAGEDLNGDNDTKDFIARYFDASAGKLSNTGVEVDEEAGLSMSSKVIAFQTLESAIGANGLDLNGNGSLEDHILRYYLIDDASLAADFKAFPLSGEGSLAVEFSDKSSGDITGWEWDFGDGQTSDKQNPTHIYNNQSNDSLKYTVSLTVSNGAGSDIKIEKDYITVSAPPRENNPPEFIHIENQTVDEGRLLNFIVTAQDPDGDVLTYSSVNSLPAGASFNEQGTFVWTPDHSQAGDYLVTFKVEDGKGGSASQVFSLTVIDVLSVADFTADKTHGPAPLTVQFTDRSTPMAGLNSYLWDFGDGSISQEQNPVHTYDIPGAYRISLTVSGQAGEDKESKENFILVERPADNQNPTVSISTPGNGEIVHGGILIHAEAIDNVGIERVEFLIAGKTTIDNSLPYEMDWDSRKVEDGHYTLIAKAYDTSGNSAEQSIEIRVENELPLRAEFTAAPREGKAPLEVKFTDLSTGKIDSWEWTFWNGQTVVGESRAQNPVYTFTHAGSYQVSLAITNQSGHHNEFKENFILVKEKEPEDHPPVAKAGEDQTVEAGALVTLNGSKSSDPDGDELIYQWQQTNGPLVQLSGETTALASFLAVFPTLKEEMKLSFKLTVTAKDKSAEDTTTVVVKPKPPAISANFTVSPREGKAPLRVSFTDQSTGEISSWLWDFGDGQTSSEQNPQHTYTNPGDYSPFLTVSGQAGEDKETKENYIKVALSHPHPKPDRAPKAKAGEDQKVRSQDLVKLNGTKSADPDGDELIYQWRQLSGPEVVLSGNDQALSNFSAPEVKKETELKFELRVTAKNKTDKDTTIVLVRPALPQEIPFQAIITGKTNCWIELRLSAVSPTPLFGGLRYKIKDAQGKIVKRGSLSRDFRDRQGQIHYETLDDLYLPIAPYTAYLEMEGKVIASANFGAYNTPADQLSLEIPLLRPVSGEKNHFEFKLKAFSTQQPKSCLRYKIINQDKSKTIKKGHLALIPKRNKEKSFYTVNHRNYLLELPKGNYQLIIDSSYGGRLARELKLE